MAASPKQTIEKGPASALLAGPFATYSLYCYVNDATICKPLHMQDNFRPKALYKYMKREHADLLVHKGRMRIGTLLDFQNIEKHRAEVGDAEEGRRTTTVAQDLSGITTFDNLSLFGNTFQNLVIEDCGGEAIYIEETSSQYYIFCASSTKDKEAMEAMGYDTCVEIQNPSFFFQLLTQRSELQSKSEKMLSSDFMMGPCDYSHKSTITAAAANNSVIGGSSVPVFFQKLPEFAYQTEFRVVWQPKGENAEPLFVQCEEIRALCRIVEV